MDSCVLAYYFSVIFILGQRDLSDQNDFGFHPSDPAYPKKKQKKTG